MSYFYANLEKVWSIGKNYVEKVIFQNYISITRIAQNVVSSQ